MKIFILTLATIVISISVRPQVNFEVKDFGQFKLHSYATNDPMDDMSYIIEGEKGLVVLEPAAFFENIKELGEYITKLNKPVEKVIANYHAAGFSGFDHPKFVMIEGMPEFVKGDIYSGMMKHFQDTFGEAIDNTKLSEVTTIANYAVVKWVGVEFKFSQGSSSDFPTASILIGRKVYYTHFAPVANMHMNALQIPNREAINATLIELEQAKASGATVFIGGHGVETADLKAVNFQIKYLKKVKETVSLIKTGDEFVLVMAMSYPNISGEDNLSDLATNLYK